MKFYLSILFLVVSTTLHARFYDDFSDGDFTSNPRWFLSGIDAEIVSTNGTYAVQLTPSGVADGDKMSGIFKTANTEIDNTWWGCRLRVTSGTGSSVRFYVSSLLPSLTGCPAYYVEFDLQRRCISFVYETKSEQLLLARTPDNILPAGTSEIQTQVIHSAQQWQITCTTSGGLQLLHTTASHSSAFNPTTTGFMVTGSKGSNTPVLLMEANCGDKPSDDELCRFGDIVFTEIMPKPSPSVSLPEFEWVELYNNSTKSINLNNFKLSSKSRTGLLSEYLLEPGAYVILCSYDAMLEMIDFTENIVVVSSMPTLTNNGGVLTLESSINHKVAVLDYSSSWYGFEDFKSDGGWSLERRDISNPVDNESNWGASCNELGGTPGAANSIEGATADLTAPRITGYGIPDSKTVQFRFSKPMQGTFADLRNCISVSGNEIFELEFLEPKHNRVNIYLSEKLDSAYSVDFSFYDMSCISGIPMNDTTISISLPRKAGYMDVIFNEIMPHVTADRSKFVEFYNNSDFYVDLGRLMISNVSDEGQLLNSERLSHESLILPPHNYVVASSDTSRLECNAGINPASQYISITLPSMTGKVGTLLLSDRGGQPVDQLSWSSQWHHPSLIDTRNVSLERLSTIKATSDSTNWASASQSVGFNTAGWSNSQAQTDDNTSPEADGNQYFWLEDSHFSPDNDGNCDQMVIRYSLPASGFEFTADIYTRDGTHVCRIADNELLSLSGEWTWDGSNRKGSIVEPGLYVIVIEAFHPDHNLIKKRLITILG